MSAVAGSSRFSFLLFEVLFGEASNESLRSGVTYGRSYARACWEGQEVRGKDCGMTAT